MADFVAVIRRAVDGLSDDTPELRAKVYEKARGAVLRQLESMKPRPPEEMLRRQLEKLEAAIREVEAEHAEALPAAEEAETIAAETIPAEPIAEKSAPAAPNAEPAPVAEQASDAMPSSEAPEWQGEQPSPAVPASATMPVVPEEVHVAPAPAETVYPEVAAVSGPAPAVESPVVFEEPRQDAPGQVAAPAAAPAAVIASPSRAPTLWDDESWADEDDSQPAAQPVAPPPVAPAPVSPPAAERYAETFVPQEPPRPVEPVVPLAPVWQEPEPVPAGPVEPAAPAQAVEPYPGFEIEDPTEKYAAMEPVAIAEPLAEPAASAEEWPAGGLDVDANARIGEEEWAASAAYEPPADLAQPTFEQETGLPVSPDQPVVDPLAWSGDVDPAPRPADPAVGFHADLAAPAQSYFDEPVLAAQVDETPEAAAEPVAPVVPVPPPVAPVAKPAASLDDDWDLLGADLPPLNQPAPATPASSQARQWDDNLFDDVAPAAPAPAARKQTAEDDQWEAFEDFDAYDGPADTSRETEEDPDDLLYANVEKPARSYRIEPKRRFDFTSIGLGLLGLLLVAGSGYGAWVFRDTLSGLVTGLVSSPPAETKPKTETSQGANGTSPSTKPASGEKPAAGKTATQETASAEPEIQKFTQRLQADGSEVDEGKAAGGGAGEGKSVAEQTVASAEPATTAVPGAGTPATTETPDAAIPVGVSQKMYLYEERVGQTSPVAIEGAVVWSLKKEAGANGKPETTVEAQVSAPERKISALITFKRNLDPSLPASHLVELVFSIPKDFEGGAIESVQRVALKQTEQDRGDPLIAVPAKITDDFHMIALNDYADARAFNLKLLETRDWIDIPVTYRNGRRALITMEKGTTGSEAFKAAIREWNAEDGAAAGTPAPAQP